MRHHLGMKIEDSIKSGDLDSTNNLIFTMLQTKELFTQTDLYCSWRSSIIESYINNIKNGHILIDGNYSTLCGNGMELLKHSIDDFNGTSCMGIDEVVCTNFEPDEKLLGVRSPHVTMGNLWLCNNASEEKIKTLKKYFKLTKQIIHINSIGNNILNRLSGADFDSDSVLLTNNSLLVNAVAKNYHNFAVPTNEVKPSGKTDRKYTSTDKAKLDTKISVNLIGQIVNMSQILNSILWDKINKGSIEDIEELYADIAQLDVMSGIEIDSAKKEFLISNSRELTKISKRWIDIKYGAEIIPVVSKRDKIFKEVFNLKTKWTIYDTEEKVIAKKYKPLFFDIVANKALKVKQDRYGTIIPEPERAIFKEHFTTMDYILNIFTDELKSVRAKNRNSKIRGSKVMVMSELFTNDKNFQVSKADRHQINDICKLAKATKSISDSIWVNKTMTPEEKYYADKEVKDNFILKMENKNISSHTIKKIINDISRITKKSEKNKYHGIVLLLTKTLLASHKDEFMLLFNDNMEIIQNIEQNDNGDISLYSIKFKNIEK